MGSAMGVGEGPVVSGWTWEGPTVYDPREPDAWQINEWTGGLLLESG